MKKTGIPVSGFTLIELLIVVAIIGILAAIAVPNFLQAQIRAKIARTQGTFKTMVTTLEMYRIDHGKPAQHFNSPEQNRWMTTPIAYASERPIDIFQDYTSGAQKETWANYGSNERYGCPHYETGKEDKEYWIVSIGPDKIWQTFGGGGAKTWDISNGLHSRGDIYVVESSLNYIWH